MSERGDKNRQANKRRRRLLSLTILGVTNIIILITFLISVADTFPNNIQALTAAAHAGTAQAIAETAQANAVQAAHQAQTRQALALTLQAVIGTLTPMLTDSITPISAFYYEANLEGFGSYAEDDLDPGAMNFEYPVYLFPSSSEVVTLKITPDLDVGTELPDIFQRIPIPVDVPLQMSEYHNHFSNILVAPQMKASLTSQGMGVSPQFSNPTKTINPTDGTLWTWIITTPAEVGNHPLYLSLYLGNNPEPIWSFSFSVSVTFPTETSLPTATNSPTPAPTQTLTLTPTLTVTPSLTPTKTTGQQFIDVLIRPETISSILGSWGAVIAAIVGAVGLILGALIGQRTRLLKPKKDSTSGTDKPAQGKNTKGNNKEK